MFSVVFLGGERRGWLQRKPGMVLFVHTFTGKSCALGHENLCLFYWKLIYIGYFGVNDFVNDKIIHGQAD